MSLAPAQGSGGGMSLSMSLRLRSRSRSRLSKPTKASEIPRDYGPVRAVRGRRILKEKKKKRMEMVFRRFLPEVTFTFNDTNTPSERFSLRAIADRGFEVFQWTTFRLNSETLFLQGPHDRFEICEESVKETEEGPTENSSHHGHLDSLYRLSRVVTSGDFLHDLKRPIPLEEGDVEVLERGLGWESFEWGDRFVKVCGKEFPILSVNFVPNRKVNISGKSDE